jgi:WD40 repeat protein
MWDNGTSRRRCSAFGTVAIVCILGWAGIGTVWVAADTSDSRREPTLRIETGTHTAAVAGIATDAENNYLVTASEDKTIRVWNLPSGRQKQQ